MHLNIVELIQIAKMRLEKFENLNPSHHLAVKAANESLNEVIAEINSRFAAVPERCIVDPASENF